MTPDEKPFSVDADAYRRLIEADAYDAQASIESAVRQVEQLRGRIAAGQPVVIVCPGAPLLIKSSETLDGWVSTTLPSTWAVMQANVKLSKPRENGKER